MLVKDHKEGFPGRVKHRLVNPAKSNVCRISQRILARVNKKVRDEEEGENEENHEGDDYDSEDEEKEEQEAVRSKRVKIDGRQGLYTESITIIDRYKARPIHLDRMCLGQFAISYIYTSRVPKRVTFDDDGCSTEYSNQKIFEDKVSWF